MNHLVKKAVSLVTMAAMMIGITGTLKTDAETQTTAYLKYDYDTNNLTSYELNITDQTISTQTRGIVGVEARQRDGHDGIVGIFSNSLFIGTGFIVGDHTIATAAHCVYSEFGSYPSTNNFYPFLKIQTYNENGTESDSSPFTVKEAHMNAGYVNYNRNSACDYALLIVEEDLSTYTHFDLGVPYDLYNSKFGRTKIYTTGIPQSLGDGEINNVPFFETYSGFGYPYDDLPEEDRVDGILYFTCDATEGNSGGPVYTAVRYTITSGEETEEYYIYTALGIVSRSGKLNSENPERCQYNEASLMGSEKIRFYMSNPYVSY